MSMHTEPPLHLEPAKAFLLSEAERIETDPLTNSVFALAQTLFRAVETGSAQVKDLAALAGEVHLDMLQMRAGRFRDQHFGADTTAAWAPVRTRLEDLAGQGWETFRREVEQPTGGIVFTAHPTFALSRALREAFARHVCRPTKKSEAALKDSIDRDGRAWNRSISLPGEHEEVQHVLANAAGALKAYADLVIDVARLAFPDHWRTLRPYMPTLASWVGYDLDGRTDIHWSQSITFRLREKAEQLGRYARRLNEIAEAHGTAGELDAFQARLSAAAAATTAHAERFSADLTDADTLVAAANALTEESETRLTDAAQIISAIEAAIPGVSDDHAAALMALRAQVETLQLGTARIHLRVNAAQVRTVINRDLGLETEDRELGRLALAELSEKARTSKPLKVNFADLFLEQSTARRQFMMCAQILKHIDAGSVIRFLIAESENPATVMGALYLARQHGVEDKVDISPLFETPEALETGGRFIERLLEEPQFLDYIRARGYLSIQLGFSDAGRFIGQVAADMAIERIHNLIARALAAKADEVDLLLFNTHGESMGRGAWPGSFGERFDHLLTPWTRGQARARGLRLRHEVSFQGGDGFLHFLTPELAETSYAAFAAHALSDPPDTSADPFYTRTDLVWDFYRALRAWHERLFVNPDYGRLLTAFSDAVTVKAGSRQKRRSGGPTGPRALRAISHNATLQQLAVPANTATGIGSSLQREIERLVGLINQSPRMRGLVLLAVRARVLTSLPALRGYSRVYDPSVWAAFARFAPAQTAPAYRAVYYTFRDETTAGALDRIASHLSMDLRRFDRLLAQLDSAPSIEERHMSRLDLHVLHAVRQALMMHAFALIGRLPRLSGRHDATQRDLARMLARLQVGEAVSLLCRIFPRSHDAAAPLSALSEPGSGKRSAQGYDRIHREIIQPLDEISQALHSISLAITHAYGAFG